MSKSKPGFIRRLGIGIGRGVHVLGVAVRTLVLLFFLSLLASLLFDYAPPLPARAFLEVAPGGVLVEQLSYSEPLARLVQRRSPHAFETLARDLVEAIDSAAADPRIAGIALGLDDLSGGGITKLAEVGSALERFRASGKPIVAVGTDYTQEQYYLASFASEIHLNPMGAVNLTGFGAYHPYFKDALDKLKLNVHIFRVGDYKDAVEPFERNDMSPASRAQTALWLNALWGSYTDRVEAQRKLTPGAINDYVNNLDVHLSGVAGDSARLAVERGLVDQISSDSQMRARLEKLAGVDEKTEEYVHVTVDHYLDYRRLEQPKVDSGDKIGVIVAAGTIVDGEAPDGSIGSESLSALVRQAAGDEALRALVLRIDSPGGSAVGSDVIRREIDVLQKKGIPVVVSMGSLAASGGYWIAASADRIFAEPTTLTGSIGVFGIAPTFEASLAYLGVHNDGIGTTAMADGMHADRAMTPQMERVIQFGVNHTYQQFIQLVATGRKLPLTAVDAIAGGRVWTGAKAVELGLVDELGGMTAAVATAAKLAKLDSYQLEYIRRPLSFNERLLERFARTAERRGVGRVLSGLLPPLLPASLEPPLRALAAQLGVVATLTDPRGLYLQCFECRAP